MENIIEEYIQFVIDFLIKFYRTLLGDTYDEKIVKAFIDKYVNVRYYNITNYPMQKSFIERINKELRDVADELIKQFPDKKETIKNTFALMGYVLYLDDCVEIDNIVKLNNALLKDTNIKLEYTDEAKEAYRNLIRDFNKKKKDFFKVFESEDFELKFRRLKRNLQYVHMAQHCNISKLYSDYAVEKAFNSGVVEENKYYLLYYLLTEKILTDVISLNFDKTYVVELPISLLGKEKKIKRYLRILDGSIVKNKISIRYSYKDYVKNKEKINKLINLGYKISLLLDETFDNDFDCLILFKNVFVYEKYEYYDIIMNSEDKILKDIVVTL